MKAHKRALGSVLMVLVGMGLVAPMSSAEEINEDQLGNASIPAAVDYNTRLNDYYRDDSLLGDAKFFSGFTYGDNAIRKASRQAEALYRDLVNQQDDDNPIVRTRDLPSPFTTSVFTLQSPANFSEFDVSQ